MSLPADVLQLAYMTNAEVDVALGIEEEDEPP